VARCRRMLPVEELGCLLTVENCIQSMFSGSAALPFPDVTGWTRMEIMGSKAGQCSAISRFKCRRNKRDLTEFSQTVRLPAAAPRGLLERRAGHRQIRNRLFGPIMKRENPIGLYNKGYSGFGSDAEVAVRRSTYGEDIGQSSWMTADEWLRFADQLRVVSASE